MVDQFSEADNRKQTFERDIKGFAPKRYVMKELVMQVSSRAWDNSFYQKTAASLTGGTGSSIKGIPRGADFPSVVRGTTLKSAIILQHGGEGVIYWIDILTSNIRTQAETISDVTDADVFSVDNEIYSALTQNDTPTLINTVAIAAGFEWDSDTLANRDPVQDLLNCIKEVTIDRYPILTSGMGFAVMNETDYANMMGNSKVINHPTFKLAEGIIRNGNLARLVGLGIKVSPVVTVDKLLLYGKEMWKLETVNY
ncbi:hypothetical protein LCGC14_2873520, partial [marine sediment metagenome]